MDISKAFERLGKALSKTPLNTSNGRLRQAEAREFMYKHGEISTGRHHFQHINTRNNLVLEQNGKLTVPGTDEFDPTWYGEYGTY